MTTTSTIDPKEAAHFGALAADWWDPKGSSAMLHKLNPLRLGYVRAAIDRRFGTDETDLKPLAGKRVADVGCGAGLLAEPLVRLGGRVTGIDAAPENVAAARAHAQGQRLEIDYRVGGTEALEGAFDLIMAMEVVEHVADVPAFVAGLAGALATDGLLILSTPNRTVWAKLVMIGIGEGTGRIPRGTHDWDKFLTPEDLATHLRAASLTVIDTTGLSFSLSRGFRLSDDMSLNYLVTATRA